MESEGNINIIPFLFLYVLYIVVVLLAYIIAVLCLLFYLAGVNGMLPNYDVYSLSWKIATSTHNIPTGPFGEVDINVWPHCLL